MTLSVFRMHWLDTVDSTSGPTGLLVSRQCLIGYSSLTRLQGVSGRDTVLTQIPNPVKLRFATST